MKILERKKAIILGLANDRSLAWGITKSIKEEEVSIALSYMKDAIKKEWSRFPLKSARILFSRWRGHI